MKKPNLLCYNYWQSIADHVLDFSYEQYEQVWGIHPLERYPDFDPEKVKEGDLVFVKTDFIMNDTFYDYYFSKIKVKFNLITGASSFQLGQAGSSFIKLLFDEKILNWFCTNPPNVKHDKIVPLPIGFAEPCRPEADQEILNYWLKNHTPWEEKTDKVFLPYHNITTPDRKLWCEQTSRWSNTVTQQNQENLNEYLLEMNKYKYIICLAGTGLDTHRFYEANLVDSVPIIIDNGEMRKVLDNWNLSSLFIDSWENETWAEVEAIEPTYIKMTDQLLCETYKKKIMEIIH